MISAKVKFLSVGLVLFSVLINCAWSATEDSETTDEPFEWDDIIKQATSSDFEETISDTRGPALAMFYAPWCAHCKTSKKPFQDSAQENPQNTFVAVNCDDEQEFCSDQEIEGYPTFKLYKDGKFVKDFKGQRTKSAFNKLMAEKEKKDKKKEEKDKKKDEKDKKKKKEL